MSDSHKTKKQLLDDIAKLRRKITRLESRKERPAKIKTALLADESNYRKLFKNLPDAAAAVDMSGRIIECNSAFQKMLGYNLRDLKKLSYADITPAKWHTMEKSILEKQVLLRGYSDVYRKEYRNKKGKVFPVELRAFLMLDNKKNPMGMWAIIRDITKQYKVERAIQKSEEKFRSLVETINDWVWEVNKKGLYTYASPKVQELLGYEPQEIIGKKPADFMPAEEAKRLEPILADTFRRGIPIINLVNFNLHKDGHIVVLETNGRPIFDDKGEFAGFRGVDRDITERKKAEDALKESEATLKSIFRAAPTGIGLMSDGVIKQANDRFCELIGYTRDELIGQNARLIYPTLEEYEKVGKVKYEQISRNGTGSIETKMRRKDGRIINVRLSSTPLNPNDLAQGVTFTALDITDRKRAEEALLASEREKAVILDSVSENVTLQDKELKILWANRAALKSVRPENSEVIGKHCHEVWNRRQERCTRCPVQKALDTGNPEEAEMMSPDGRYWWVRGFPVKDDSGSVTGVVEVTKDITEQKTAETKLIAERNFTDSIINSLPGMFYLFDDKGKFIRWNKNFETVSGCTAEEIALMQPLDFFVGDDKKMVEEKIGEVFAKGKSQVEASFMTKSGLSIPYYFTGLRLEIDDKLYLVGTGIDITGLKQAEAKLRESEEKYRNVVERAYDAIVIVQDYVLKYANPRLAELLGYEINELVNLPYKNFIHPDELDRINELYSRRVKGEPVSQMYETRLAHKNGSTIYTELNGGLIQYEGRAADLVFIRDITERKKAEEKLKSSEKRYQELFDSVLEGIALIDGSETVVYCNPAFAQIFGEQSHIDMIGEVILDYVRPEQRDLLLKQTMLRKQGENSQYELELLLKNGEEKSIYVSSSPRFDDRHNYLGTFSAVIDITEQKSLEAQFLQSQKMESIGRLAGGVAHDFNNLLTAIIGHSEIALMNIPKEAPMRKDIMVIQEAADRAADLTRQLLAFSRKQTLEPKIIDLNEIIENMAKMLQRIIGEDITLKAYPFENLWPVTVDPGQIGQVIINLAVNARDAMPGGGTLTIETANVDLNSVYKIKRRDITPGPYVLLSISDTGMGIPDEVQEHIFEPFYTTKKKGQGTGLGLSTVFGIVNQSGGHIWVYSEINKGTTFKIYLPRAEGEIQTTAPGPKPKSVPAGSETILIVEDEKAVREIACKALENLGYKIIEVALASDAIELCRRNDLAIDLIITDVVMPNAGGTEMMAEINKIRPKLRALYMSGYTENAIVEKGILKPGIFYIQKPFRPRDLGLKVREVLDQSPKTP